MVDPRHARSRDYRKVIAAIAREGRCPFCSENFRYHKKPILQQRGGWMLTDSSWPYRNAERHFLLIGPHRERLEELTPDDFSAVRTLIRFAVKRYHLPGGALALRFGDTKRSGSTVVHLHFHLIVPAIDRRTGRAKTVRFPIG